MILNTNSIEEMNNLRNEKQKGLVMILFYATWCGHCSAMEPEWEKLQENHPENVSLAKVESEDYNNYEMSPNEDRVQGYPTVRLYHHDKMVKEFDGERNFETMYQFIEDYLNEHPETRLNNLLLLRGKKTNQHNAELLKTLRTNKKIKKLSVKKMKRKRSTTKKQTKKEAPLKKKAKKGSTKPKGKKPSTQGKVTKRKPGRPKGSKTKKK